MSRSLPIEFLGGIFCFVAFAALITFIIYQTLKRQQARPGAVPPIRNPQANRLTGVKTTLGKDGFWIRGNRLRPGARVRYRYFVDDQPMDGDITYYPGSEGHFVYTGHIPAAIEILHVLDAGTQRDYEEPDSSPPAPDIAPSWTNDDRQDRGHSHGSSRAFSGPPAY
jgi:hypothetical protein